MLLLHLVYFNTVHEQGHRQPNRKASGRRTRCFVRLPLPTSGESYRDATRASVGGCAERSSVRHVTAVRRCVPRHGRPRRSGRWWCRRGCSPQAQTRTLRSSGPAHTAAGYSTIPHGGVRLRDQLGGTRSDQRTNLVCLAGASVQRPMLRRLQTDIYEQRDYYSTRECALPAWPADRRRQPVLLAGGCRMNATPARRFSRERKHLQLSAETTSTWSARMLYQDLLRTRCCAWKSCVCRICTRHDGFRADHVR